MDVSIPRGSRREKHRGVSPSSEEAAATRNGTKHAQDDGDERDQNMTGAADVRACVRGRIRADAVQADERDDDAAHTKRHSEGTQQRRINITRRGKGT